MNKINKIIMLVSAALMTQGCYDNDKIKKLEEKIEKLEKAQKKSAKNGQEKYNNLELNEDAEDEFGEYSGTIKIKNFEDNEVNEDWLKDQASEPVYNAIKSLQNKELSEEEINNNIENLLKLTDEEKKEILTMVNDVSLNENVVKQIKATLGVTAEEQPAESGEGVTIFNLPINNATLIANQ